MYRPENKPMKQNPNGVNNKAPIYQSSLIQNSTNIGGSSTGKVTNAMRIPVTQGYVGPSITTKVKR